MGYLEQVKKGRVIKPYFILPFGPHGSGKSTLASEFPEPFFLDIEGGSNYLDVARLTPKSFPEVLKILDELLLGPNTYQTLVIDSLDTLETLCWADVCIENKWKSIEEPGYGRGYVASLEKWQKLLSVLKLIREKMNVVLIGHSQIKPVNDPTKLQSYDRHEIKLNAKASALFKEAVDAIFFVTHDVKVVTDKSGKGKGFGDGKRVLFTQSMPGHEGKNRYGLPYEIELEIGKSYQKLHEEIQKRNPTDPSVLMEQIQRILPMVKDEAIREKAEAATKAADQNVNKLLAIFNRLEILVSS